MVIHLITLFPDFFMSPLQTSILKRAQKFEAVEIQIHNLRDFAVDAHQTTDDRPFGGGPGMVMLVEPIDRCLTSLGIKKGGTSSNILLTSAKGKLFTQKTARQLSQLSELVIICGHYEGVDERVADNLIDQEIRVGDYVLTGGEIPALTIVDSVARLLPGVLGNDKSNENESHQNLGELGFPQYSRPEKYLDWSVPQVLLSGNHAKIAEWREQNKKSTNQVDES